jgi:hypothetical protein
MFGAFFSTKAEVSSQVLILNYLTSLPPGQVLLISSEAVAVSFANTVYPRKSGPLIEGGSL